MPKTVFAGALYALARGTAWADPPDPTTSDEVIDDTPMLDAETPRDETSPSITNDETSEPLDDTSPEPDVASAGELATDDGADADDDEVLEALLADDVQARAEAQRRSARAPLPTFMRPEGVDDPFPDRTPVIRPYEPTLLLGTGVTFAAAAAAMAHLALRPDCIDEHDASTCDVPDGADIGVRGGRLVGSTAFALGGALFGALGGSRLGDYLQRDARGSPARRRRIALGVGATSLAVGVTGLVVGSSVFGVGTHRAVALARTFEGSAPPLSDADLARLDRTLDEVRFARRGLMVMTAAPAFVAAGIAVLVHRPGRHALRVQPLASRTLVGMSATLRF